MVLGSSLHLHRHKPTGALLSASVAPFATRLASEEQRKLMTLRRRWDGNAATQIQAMIGITRRHQSNCAHLIAPILHSISVLKSVLADAQGSPRAQPDSLVRA